MNVNIGIVIPFRNDRAYLQQNLENYKSYNYPIVFVSMGSIDGSIDLINEAKINNSQLMQGAQNRAAAYNMGIDQIVSDFVLLLEPATSISQGSIDILARKISEDKTIGTVTGLAINAKGVTARTGLLFSRCEIREADRETPTNHERVQRPWDFKVLTSDALMIRRDPNMRFDERYLEHYEDYDYTLRVFKSGLRNAYEPSALFKSIRLPVWQSPQHYLDRDYFLEAQGGLSELDKLNDAGEYYGSGKSFSAMETYIHPNNTGKAMVSCFPGDYDGCGIHRIINPYRALTLRGYNTMFTSWVMPEIIEQSDVIVWQRAASDHILKMTLEARAAGKIVIYEIDDYFHGLHPHNPSTPAFMEKPEQLRRIEEIINLSSALTVTTPELAKQYGRFNTNTHILPNYADFGLLPWVKNEQDQLFPDIKLNETGTIRIGWGGSNTHDADLQLAADAVRRVMEEHPEARLVFLGWDYRSLFPNVDPSRMEWLVSTYGHEDCVGDYYKELNNARLDIGIAPIEDTIFNRAKSDIKLLEYGVFGLACVASDVAPYSDFAKMARDPNTKQKALLIAKTGEDWYKHLKRLVTNKQLRIDLGQQIQSYVWQQRGIHVHGQKIEEIIEAARAGKVHTPVLNQSKQLLLLERPELASTFQKEPKQIFRALSEKPHLLKEPIHSLSVTYMNNFTSKQVVALKQQQELSRKQISKDELALGKSVAY